MAGASGVSAYFLPYGLEGSKLQKTLLLASTSSLHSKDTNQFKAEEEEKLEKLNTLLQNLSQAVKDSKELKDIKKQDMEKLFKSILEAEKSLIKFYEKNLEIVKKLSDALQKSFNLNENKLKIQSNIHGASHLINLLKILEEFIKSREQSLQKVIDEISNNQKKLEEESNTLARGGGGQKGETQESKNAQKTLEDVKSNFLSSNLDLNSKLANIWKLSENLKNYEFNQKSLLSRLEEIINSFQFLSEDLNSESEGTQKEINNSIKELNNLKTQLRKVNKEWEIWREKVIYFQNFLGKIKNSICQNTQNTEKENCDIFEINSQSSSQTISKQ